MLLPILLTLTLFTCFGHAQEQAVVSTMNGLVRGKSLTANGKTVHAFLSIPFAKPPNGTLRFKPPQPPNDWKSTLLDVSKPAPACLQMTLSIGDLGAIPGSLRDYQGTFSEDCLYLSVWKPSNATEGTNLAVMVYIYGGGFNFGMKDYPLHNGQYLAGENNVIVVSMNYRVGILGFGRLGDDTIPGNLGLLDQVEALKWVQNNIGRFGGDPNRVTLFGESAGSWSVGLHHFSDLSKKYFNNAIMQSGAPINAVHDFAIDSAERSSTNIRRFAEYLNCPTYSDLDIYNCLMKVTGAQIIDATNNLIWSGVDFYPVVDHHFLKAHPRELVEWGDYKINNLMIGVTKDEFTVYFSAIFNPFNLTMYTTGKTLSYDDVDTIMSLTLRYAGVQQIKTMRLFYESMMSNPRENLPQVMNELGSDVMFACPASLFASHASSRTSVYFYILNYRISSTPPPLWTGVPHTYDIDLVFGHPFDPSRSYTDADREVSRMMMTYWTNFAKSGNPNTPMLAGTYWPTFDSPDHKYMALDTNPTIEQGPRRHECAFINHILPMVQYGEGPKPPPCVWPETNSSRSVRQNVGVIAAVMLLMMMTVFF